MTKDHHLALAIVGIIILAAFNFYTQRETTNRLFAYLGARPVFAMPIDDALLADPSSERGIHPKHEVRK